MATATILCLDCVCQFENDPFLSEDKWGARAGVQGRGRGRQGQGVGERGCGGGY